MTPQRRTSSAIAELMVDPECGARCAIRNTRVAGEDCYHWTVTPLGEDLPLAAACTGELAEARTPAEAALAGVTDWRGLPGDGSGNYGWQTTGAAFFGVC
jgi:hypothetical protein